MLRVSALAKAISTNPILESVDFELADASAAMISGASGAGKTSLLRLIAGVDAPDAGTIVWNGRELAGPNAWVAPWRRPFAMVFQDLALWPHLTVRQHLDFVLEGRRSLGRAERRQIRDRQLESLEIGEFAGRYPAQLSGGQQQRVAIARSLVAEPELLLLDEPFAHLDEALRDRVWSQIAEWHKASGSTLIIVSHDTQGLAQQVDCVYRLDKGRLAPVNQVATDLQPPVSRLAGA